MDFAVSVAQASSSSAIHRDGFQWHIAKIEIERKQANGSLK
jgi:hypothetical protein